MALTLSIWRKQFSADPGAAARLGFDDVFRRMWTLYLCYAEAGFRSGYLDISQLLLIRPGDPPRPG
jgi:cyclopropane-fatty-acyl-phospholipid synthase